MLGLIRAGEGRGGGGGRDLRADVFRGLALWFIFIDHVPGNPLADFTYHLMMYRMPPSETAGLVGRDLPGMNIPSEEEYVAAYCRRTNRPDGIPNLDFYLAYNFFRLAAIFQGILGRVRDGTAANAEAASMARQVRVRARNVRDLERALERIRGDDTIDHTESIIVLSRLIERG